MAMTDATKFWTVAAFLTATLHTVGVFSDPGPCPTDWKPSGKYHPGWCYLYVEDLSLPMPLAESYCQGYGAHLVSILDVLEQGKVNTISDYEDDIWTGLKQKDDSTDDAIESFEWTDGSQINLNFAPFINCKIQSLQCHTTDALVLTIH